MHINDFDFVCNVVFSTNHMYQNNYEVTWVIIMARKPIYKRVHILMSNKEQELVNVPLEKLKKEYADKVCAFIETLPPKWQRKAYIQSGDVFGKVVCRFFDHTKQVRYCTDDIKKYK